jgi:hypothetical protein
MKIPTLLSVAALATLVAGCPRNEYTVDLIPHGKTIERQLVFQRTDGSESNGVPKYASFPTNELATITALYPPGQVTHEGERHFARGEFSGALPNDVGGAGTYQCFSTSPGSAAFYVERFRGNEDLANRTKALMTAADQTTDLIIGWSHAELCREPGYKKLRRFLDGDFRRDLQNLALYLWAGEISSSYKKPALEEFAVRMGLYLVERGYLNSADAAALVHGIYGDTSSTFASAGLQRLIANKLGLPPSGPMPKALAFLADPVAMEASWKKYLARTDAYQALLRQWQKDSKRKPDLKKPEPQDVTDAILSPIFDALGSGGSDHLVVRLSLASAPDHSNGQWDASRQKVQWESDLDTTNRLPVFCYASWSHPDRTFQQAHFGRTILIGDELLKYCLWHEGLYPAQSAEWDKWLATLQPGNTLTNQVAAFQFSATSDTNTNVIGFGKDLIKSALESQP